MLAIGQTAWEQLEANNNESVEIIYSDESLMIGQLVYPPSLLVSEDFAVSWDVIESIPEQKRIPFVRKKYNGDYLILLDEKILSWTSGAGNFTEILDLEEGTWTSAEPLPNDNFLVTGIGEPLSLYDSGGNLLKTLATARIQEIITTSGDEHYFFQGNPFGNMVTINSDLEVLKEGAPDLYVSDHFKFDGSRFYNSRFYSDDGDTWLPYGDNLYGVVTFLNNGDLHFIADCAYSNTNSLCESVYVSSDRGETFQFLGDLSISFTLPSAGSVNFRTNTYLGTQAIGPNGILIFDDAKNYFSEDAVTNWELRGQEVGLPYAFDVEAESKEGLIIREEAFKYHKSDGEDWGNLVTTDSCDNFRWLESLPNGEFITIDGCKSNDGGSSWSGPNLGTWGVYVKKDFVFAAGGSQLYISNDNGDDWAVTDLPMQSDDWDFFVETNVYDFSTTGFMYLNQFIANTGPAKYNLQGDLIQPLDFPNEFVRDLRTEYDGPTVYVLTVASGGIYKFYVSALDAEIFVGKDLPSLFTDSSLQIEVDHEGRVYLYGDSEIWKSEDDGTTWVDLSPDLPEGYKINDFDVSWDGFAFAATEGSGVLRTVLPVCEEQSTSTLNVEVGDHHIYPNPVKDQLHVTFDEIENYVDFKVLNGLGVELTYQSLDKGPSEYIIDVSDFEPGYYLMVLKRKNNTVETKQFIVAR